MSSYIYIEGGASGPNSKNLTIRCQQAFRNLMERMGITAGRPRLVACGPRASVYERFCIQHKAAGGGYVAMWIDSEEPMADIEKAWNHLAEVTTVAAWEKPEGAADDQVLFMTTCMETWIVSDRKALQAHYGRKLRENTLPSLSQLESKGRHDVQERLERSTQDCRNSYAKGKRSFDVLEQLEPATLKQHLPSFVRVDRILKIKL